MDEISNKALLIGVGLFITIIITSGVFYVLSQMKDIYSQVYETNISLQDMFSEYDQYDNTNKTGIDLYNTVKKYRNNSLVIIKVGNAVQDKETFISNNSSEDSQVILGSEKYITTLEKNLNTGEVIITFTAI